MKRVIALLLVCCTLALALVACGGGENKTTAATKPVKAPEATDIYGQTQLMSKYDWSTMNFDGETITVMVRNDTESRREWGKEDVGDDSLDIAIAERNEIVADTINVEVILEPVATSG